MTEESEKQKSWLDRLADVFLREPKDLAELRLLLEDAREKNILDADAFRMIEGVLQVSIMKVRDVMVPRPQMVVIEGDAAPNEALPIIISSGHSRFPVTGESQEEILGILLAKDLLKIINEKKSDIYMRDLIRPVTFVPESKRLDILLKEFRIQRNHMAVVVDEYGGISGLVTIEDVLEEIVGEIEDEFDLADEEPDIKKTKENEYIVKALTPIEDFNEYFGTVYHRDDYDTVGGLVIQKIGHLPKRGESIKVDSFKFTVVQASNRGILLLRVKKI